jgi:hypothetical protein
MEYIVLLTPLAAIVALVIHRVFKHRERLEMIAQGINPEPPKDPAGAQYGFGSLIIGAALGYLFALYLQSWDWFFQLTQNVGQGITLAVVLLVSGLSIVCFSLVRPRS